MLNGLFKPLGQSAEVNTISKGLDSQVQSQMVFGVSGSQIAYLMAGVYKTNKRPILLITYSTQQSRKIFNDLRSLLPEEDVLLFPAAELIPYETYAHSNEIAGQRIGVIAKMVKEQPAIVVAPVDSLLSKLSPKNIFLDNCWQAEVGKSVDLNQVISLLIIQGYERVDMVEGPGQFSIRGGILDIFSLTEANPLRIEFFDDEIDSIREFDVLNQRSLNKITRALIPPAKEIIYQVELYPEVRSKIIEELKQQINRLKKMGLEEAQGKLSEQIKEHLELLEQGVTFEGLTRYSHYFYPQPSSLLDYLTKEWIIAIDEPARVAEYCQHMEKERGDTVSSLLGKGLALPSLSKMFISFEEIWKQTQSFQSLAFSLLPKHPGFVKPGRVISVIAKSMHGFLGHFDLLENELRAWRKSGFAILILAETEGRCQKLQRSLREKGLEVIYLSSLKDELRPGNMIITEGSLQEGFELTQARLVVITENEIFGQRKKSRRKKVVKAGNRLEPFTDLKIGDYVVHVSHGIGRYLGVERLDIAGLKKDYFLIKYAGEDKLYVPTDQVSLVQKYLGSEGAAPRLNKLGGSEWARIKSKVKESVREMAKELINLYAVRQSVKGYAFSEDNLWQKEFEDAFPYEETPDQIKSISEIKEDMEQEKPMDRLLCGDVGYGKTEVAIRGAFKALMDGKQVAVLVPTTILAQQHHNTFRERFSAYPVTIEMLSRFRSPKEQRETIRKLALGEADIVIGTHRLVQGDVKFKDLGLLIVDEEQRFGVSHKEKLKQLKKNVDVLTLSATPIPRTLHMSLTGVRDMSILESPPEDRYPVQTYVVEFNTELIRDAVLREINRGGQIYFVHNRINDINKVAVELQNLLPEARIAVGHGQMREEELEQVILDFIEGEYDILVCTTIIETGLDIPNVNTIIINNADQMGLAQLYQLRGRVGRSNRLAYAYLTYRKDKVLSEIAEKRLRAIREFTEFGSGFKIAMRDLEIRGTGNILGPEQHGQMVTVGFDMYCRLLEEAVKELQGKETVEQPEPTIEIQVDVFIDDNYIADQGTKMEIYKKVMLVRELKDAHEVEEELEDRFGDLPESVTNLVTLAKMRGYCYQLGVNYIGQQNNSLVFKFNKQHSVTGEQLVALAQKYPNVSYSVRDTLEIKLKIKDTIPKQILSHIVKFFADLKSLEVSGQGLV